MKDNYVDISIVVPVYNVEKYLTRCLDSIISQSFKNIEIILVDDGSTDSSGIICDYYRKVDTRIKVIHKENGGLSDARNEGIKHCTGKYVYFVDSDDYLELETCQVIKNVIDNKYDIIQGFAKVQSTSTYDYKCFYTENILSGEKYFKKALMNREFYDPVFLRAYRLDFLKENNLYFKKNFYHEDVDFTTRVFLKAKTVKCIDHLLYNYIIREGSITTKKDKSKNLIDLFNICIDLISEIKILDDKKLYRLISDKLVNDYLSLYYSADGYKYKIDKKVKKFCFFHSFKIKTTIKSMIFCINTTLYWKINFNIKKWKS